MGSQTVQETVKKMDQAMSRLQELQCTVAGGSKVCGGVNLSPRSTRGYLRTSLRCKEESLRMKELAMKVVGENNLGQGEHCEGTYGLARVYGELRRSSSVGEWRRWSMPAVLIQQAVGEILEASNSAKEAAYLISDLIQNKQIESPKTPESSLNEKHPYLQGKQCYCRDVLDDIERPDLDRGKALLQKSSPTKPGRIACKLRMMVKDASSSLKNRRKAEKQELSARARAELPQAGMRVRRQMSFQASHQVKEPGRTEESSSSKPVSHCSFPSGSVGQETSSSAKPPVKLGQIKPAQKPWISRFRSAKAIMFPNPAFISSLLKHWEKSPKHRRKHASMRKNSLSSVQDMGSSITTETAPPFCKEKGPSASNEETSVKLAKSSSFSEVYEPNASKLIRQSSMPSALNRTMKQSHVINASAASISIGNPPSMSISHKVALKFDNISSPGKIKSPKYVSFSKQQGGLGTEYPISTCNPPAIDKISMLSEVPVESLVQPVPCRWPSRKGSSSSPINPMPHPKAEDEVSKIVVVKGAGAVQGLLDPMPWERRQRKMRLQIAETVNKETPALEDYSSSSSALKVSETSVNEMPYEGNILERSCSLRYPKQVPFRPIDINCDLNSFGRSNSNMDTSKEELTKDNGNNRKEEENDVRARKSSSFIKRSWSLRHDNVTLLGNGKLNNHREGSFYLFSSR